MDGLGFVGLTRSGVERKNAITILAFRTSVQPTANIQSHMQKIRTAILWHM